MQMHLMLDITKYPIAHPTDVRKVRLISPRVPITAHIVHKTAYLKNAKKRSRALF